MWQCDKCNTPIEDLDAGGMFISEDHVYCPDCTELMFGDNKRKSGFAVGVKEAEDDTQPK